MAWQPYVNEMMKNGSLVHAAIVGHNGAVWAQSQGFSLSKHSYEQLQEDGSKKMQNVDEAQLVLEPFADGMMKSGSGLWIMKKNYMVLTHNPGTNSCYIASGSSNVGCMVKTNQCILIGLCTVGSTPTATKGNANKDVEELAEKLKAVGY